MIAPHMRGRYSLDCIAEITDKCDGAFSHRAQHGDQLDNVEAALAGFIFCDKGLRLPQSLGNLCLRHPGAYPQVSQHRDENAMFRGVDALRHAPRAG